MASAVIDQQRREAKQGDFFFAEFLVNNRLLRRSPVYIVGADLDPEDVIICICTRRGRASCFDILVQLKRETFVRVNKIYTIRRSDLIFKIEQETVPPEKHQEIMRILKQVFQF